MKIGVELQPLLHKKTGIGWYSHHLIESIAAREDSLEGLIFNLCSRHELNLDELGLSKIMVNEWMPYSLYRRIWSFLPIGYHHMFREKCDIYHFLNYIVPPAVEGKVILNVYDMVYKRYPETMHERTLKNLERYLKNLKDKVDRIVTISEFSKSEILEFIEFDPQKIHVVYPGVNKEKYSEIFDSKTKGQVLNHYGITKPYFLFVGTIEPRKNIGLVINAYEKFIKENGPTHQLVLVGMKGWGTDVISPQQRQLIGEENIVMTGYISEEEKVMLYQDATAFVFPSFYEGFGMPVTEAMAASTPVILSDIPVFREIAGEGALYVDPHDPDELCLAMNRLINESSLRERLIEEGQLRVQEYTWEKAAAKMIQIYRQLADE